LAAGKAAPFGDWRLANFLRQQILVAFAASRVVGGSGRGPETGTPAKTGAAHDDFSALVDHVHTIQRESKSVPERARRRRRKVAAASKAIMEFFAVLFI
jgi:hypothetical protein